MLGYLWPESLLVQSMLVGGAVALLVYYLTKKKYKMPPGPRGWPVIGNLSALFNGFIFETFHEWSKTYGPIMKVHLGMKPVIVLSRIDVVLEALVKKGSDFAGRPFNYTSDFLTDGSKDIAAAPSGPTWKLHRKIASKALRHYLMRGGMARKASESLVHITELMKKETGPFDPLQYLSLMVFNILSGLCFNKISAHTKDERFHVFTERLQEMNDEMASGVLEDFIPIFRKWHTSKFYRIVKIYREISAILKSEVNEHRDTFNKDNIRDFTDAILLAQQEAVEEEDPVLLSQITDTHVELTIGDVFMAGQETTRQTLQWCLLALALNQDIQQKVQDEVDQVLGPELTVRLDDRAKLPYTMAFLYEMMRIRTIAAMGIPHETMQDTTLGGYEIPKGTMVMINHHALHHDSEKWEDVEELRPERFLDASGELGPKPESWLPFSAGRRVCLGETVARPELHLLLAGLCRAFHIELAPGTTHDFRPVGKGVSNQPGPYQIVVTSRI